MDSGIQSYSTGQNYGADQGYSAGQSYGGSQDYGTSRSDSTGSGQGASRIYDANHDYGDSLIDSAGDGSWHGFGDGRDENVDWNGVAIQECGASQSDDTGPSHDAGQNYNANHDYGDSLIDSAGDGSWHGFGDGRDENVDWNGVAIRDHAAGQDYNAGLDYGDSLIDSTGNADWHGFPDGRDQGLDRNSHATQNHGTSQSEGTSQAYDASQDSGQSPDKKAGDGHEFGDDRDENLDWNGVAVQDYDTGLGYGTSQDHSARQDHGDSLEYDARTNYGASLGHGISQTYNASPDYGNSLGHGTSQAYNASPDYGNSLDHGMGLSGWRQLRGDRDRSLDWNGRVIQNHGESQNEGISDTSLSVGVRQEHDARQNDGVDQDYGDSLRYSAGNADWRGFDNGRDEGVDWEGLQDHDVTRRDDALRNRGAPWGGRDFEGVGGARNVEAGTDRVGDAADSAGRRKRRGGAHRVPAPPRALKGRAAVIAVAAGAIVAAGQNLAAGSEKSPQTAELQAVGQQPALEPVSADLPTTPELLDAATPTNLGQFSDVLENGDKFAQDLAAEVEAKLRPLFTKFASGTFTSGYGERWGVLHPGVDVAAPIGTPIYAVEDGTVIDAGPAAGFGMWVRMRGDDGTVTVYGHINTALVSVGQHVLAGDEIATVGNRGESTGPHCHFEVWLNGTDRIDPLPWLATRGISLGSERD